MTDLTELLARVEAAEGASFALDTALMALFYRRGWQNIGMYDDAKRRTIKSRVWKDRETGKWVGTHPKPFTSSLDAALALVERVRPGWSWQVTRRVEPSYRADVCAVGGIPFESDAPTAPLALLAALLKSLATTQDAEAGG